MGKINERLGSREEKGFLLIFIGLGLLIAFGTVFYFVGNNSVVGVEKKQNEVVRVIDGDTFELFSGEKVRMLCIDAPEMGAEGGREAQEFLEKIILGEEVRLEKDVSERDEYGRLLRYVYVNLSKGYKATDQPLAARPEEEWIFVNKEMVRAAKARMWRYGNDTGRCGEIEEGRIS